MNSEIKIIKELRPCYYFEDNVSRSNKKKALFHQWNEAGHAIIEFDDGTCTTCEPWNIQFIRSEFKEEI